MLFISAKNRENINELKQALYSLVADGEIKQEGTIITSARHYSALLEVQRSLRDIKKGMDDNLPGDLISLDIRRCQFGLCDRGQLCGAAGWLRVFAV